MWVGQQHQQPRTVFREQGWQSSCPSIAAFSPEGSVTGPGVLEGADKGRLSLFGGLC